MSARVASKVAEQARVCRERARRLAPNTAPHKTVPRQRADRAAERRPPSVASATDSYAFFSSQVEEAVREQQQCPICMERPMDTAVDCGHRLCGACAQRITSCHACRAAVTTRLRVY